MRDAALRIVHVAKNDRLDRAHLRTRGNDLSVTDRAFFKFSSYARRVDALNAIGAFFHHAARTHSHVGIFYQLLGRTQPIVILEKIEAADFVGTVVRAVACADATIVNLQFQALLVVHCRADRADQLARPGLAMHTWHRLMLEFWIVRGA